MMLLYPTAKTMVNIFSFAFLFSQKHFFNIYFHKIHFHMFLNLMIRKILQATSQLKMDPKSNEFSKEVKM